MLLEKLSDSQRHQRPDIVQFPNWFFDEFFLFDEWIFLLSYLVQNVGSVLDRDFAEFRIFWAQMMLMTSWCWCLSPTPVTNITEAYPKMWISLSWVPTKNFWQPLKIDQSFIQSVCLKINKRSIVLDRQFSIVNIRSSFF